MELIQIVTSLAALAQETRLACYRRLVQAGPAGLAAGLLAEALGVPANTLSFHLRTLSQAGLISYRREGRQLIYRADFAHMHALLDDLTRNCCGGAAADCRPQAMAVAESADPAACAAPWQPLIEEAYVNPPLVIVLCTGNSCRSQMAEALLNHDLTGQVRALSAGTHPQPRVAEGAITALQRLGLPTVGLYPKTIEALGDESPALVVTVCDHARELCPVFPGAVKTLHMAFHDPHGEPLESFERVRDDIRARLVPAVREILGVADHSR